MVFKRAYYATAAIMFALLFAGIATCSSNGVQSVSFVETEQQSTQYRKCQETEGQYVKSVLTQKVDKVLSGCVE